MWQVSVQACENILRYSKGAHGGWTWDSSNGRSVLG